MVLCPRNKDALKQQKNKTPATPPFAKRSLGQNFLTDPNYIRKIIFAVDPQPGDRIVEIGPGRAALTSDLVRSGAEVLAIELDRDLVPILEEKFRERSNFMLLERDALQVDFMELAVTGKLKLVANLPYYISTAILQHLIDQENAFLGMVLMFQREVVERITAAPGDSSRGFLSVMVEAFLVAEKLFDVPPSAFRPAPKVWSSVVRLTPKVDSSDVPKNLRKVASFAFRQPRKTILNNLKPAFANSLAAIEAANINPRLRPEQITLEQWIALSRALDR